MNNIGWPPYFITAIAALAGTVLGAILTGFVQWMLQNRRIAADDGLAVKKFAYERQHAVFKRRFEIAEQMLTDAYRFKSTMKYVRNGISFAGEGASRTPEMHESESVKRSRDSYAVPLERISKEGEFLASMFARQTSSKAHFGPDAEKAYDHFQTALHRVRVASSLLVEWTSDYEKVDGDTIKDLLKDIWQPMAEHSGTDVIGREIEQGVQIVERLCRPVLNWTGDS